MKTPREVEELWTSSQVRKSHLGQTTLYAAIDLVALLTDRPDAAELWEDLKRWHPTLATAARQVKTIDADGHWTDVEMLTAEQALLLAQVIDSPKAHRIRLWLAEAAIQRLAEQENPELALARTRALYEHRGYSKDWVSKRLRGVSARHELAAQWYKRSSGQSDEFRDLTNQLMRGIFGMDVEQYRRHKGLRTENLRDHMNEMELALTVLGETTASLLHKQRQAAAADELARDVNDAAAVAAKARDELEHRLGRSIISGENYVRPLFKRVRARGAA